MCLKPLRFRNYELYFMCTQFVDYTMWCYGFKALTSPPPPPSQAICETQIDQVSQRQPTSYAHVQRTQVLP